LNAAPLAGLTVLVTRPQAQAQALCRALADAGATVRHLPGVAIAPIGDTEHARRHLEELARYDAVVFLSANAVQGALAIDAKLRGRLAQVRVYAVGAASVDALAIAGIEATAPAEPTSEGILALPVFAREAIAGRRVGIVSGGRGRDVLAEQLRARGAHVSQVFVYRRERPSFTATEINARIGAAAPDVLVATSAETLENLAAMLHAAGRSTLFDAALVVVSERLVTHARAHGFRGDIRVAPAAYDSEVHATLTAWADELRRRGVSRQ
jgi:uroporphyrinogen-III synthase